MSSEKTLIEHIEDLKAEAESLRKRLDLVQAALIIAQEKSSFTYKKEQNINNIQQEERYSHRISVAAASYEFLLEQQKACTTQDIMNAILSKGVKTNPEHLYKTTRSILCTLVRKNKIVQIRKGLWVALKNTTQDPI
jgi:hypothetical protein